MFPAPSLWLELHRSGHTGVPTVVQATDPVAVPLALPVGLMCLPAPPRQRQPSWRRSVIPTHSIRRYASVYLAKTRAGSLNFHYSLFVILYPEKFQLIRWGAERAWWASGDLAHTVQLGTTFTWERHGGRSLLGGSPTQHRRDTWQRAEAEASSCG